MSSLNHPGEGRSAEGPAVHTADKSGRRLPVVGSGCHMYECDHHWGDLPEQISWHETHGVAIDRNGLIYIKHRSRLELGQPSIVVFDPAGKFVRAFGQEYCGGGHGIDLREEDGQEFLYLCDIWRREVIKTDLRGEQVWKLGYPQESDLYENKEQFKPTNVAFHPDGGFYVADGYGSHYIHQYDASARYLRSWGGVGSEVGQFRTPHGLWLDDRPARAALGPPQLVVADRANARLQYFSLDGQYVSSTGGVSFPAHFDIRGDELLVPDLHSRLTILNARNEPEVHLGYSAEWTAQCLASNFEMRSHPERWQPGKFIHPHDACFDSAGNIFVVEWVPTGRVTKLQKVN